MQSRDSSLSTPLHFYRAVTAVHRESLSRPPFKRPIPRYDFRIPAEERRFFSGVARRKSRRERPRLGKSVPTPSRPIKIPESRRKTQLEHHQCPPPAVECQWRANFWQQALINLIRRAWQICGGKKIGEHVLSARIRPPIFGLWRDRSFLGIINAGIYLVESN